ncbi:glycine zipper 2TM domain-containing protein [Erythrobacter sp. HA6-11]
MKKIALAIAAATLSIPAAPALADPPAHAPAHGKRAKDRAAIYGADGYYLEPRKITRASYMWRGKDGKLYCKRDNGTTGLVIGAGVGMLVGIELAGRGDRTLGAILGGAAGAIIGREIDRGSLKCR